MNDLDDLRTALHEPPDFTPRPVDLDAVLAAGGRIRRRRRSTVGAAAALTVVALLVGGGQLLTRTASDGTRGSSGTGGVPAVAPAEPGVIRTGLETRGGEWVITAEPATEVPGTTFGFMLGRSAGGGPAEPWVMTNETEGDEKAPGFHAVQGGMTVNGLDTPTFGYYVGPAAKITARVGGRAVTADMTPWPEDNSVKVFWIESADVGDLAAYDRNGKKLPQGNAGIGVG
jgi:hypothetical protein